MTDDWDVVIESLGTSCLGYLGSADVRGVRIWLQPLEGSAHIEIALGDDSVENRSRAVEAMVDVRELFIDDLSFDYRFVSADDDFEASENPRERMAEFAVS